VLISRSLGATLQKNIYLPAPLTSYLDPGLTPGQTYTYTFTSVDRSGNQATSAATRQLTAIAVGASFTDPTSTSATRAPFPVRFASAVPSNVLFTVTYRVNGGVFNPWVSNVAGVTRVFGSAGTTGVATTTSTPGSTYQFRVSAHDAFGNATGVATSGAAVVPFDQGKAVLYGGRNLAQPQDYFGYVRILSASNHYARITITGNRLQVIGQRCASCGVFDIYEGNTRLGAFDTRAATTQVRVVLYTRTYPAIVTRTFTIRPRGTAGRPNVVLDGFAIRR